MKKIYIAILMLACIATTGLSGCMLNCVHGSGHQVTESRKVNDFSKLDISGGFKVVLKQDSSLSVKISADDNLMKYIKTVASNGRLRIYTKRSFCDEGPMTIYIGVRNLNVLKASGAVEVESDGKINTGNLHMHLAGATKVTMDLTADHVTTEGSGDTEVHLKGQATSYDIDLSGSGHIFALDFVVGTCGIQTSGVGDSEVNVLHTLSIQSSGASTVKYRGNPTVNNDKSGASTVEKVN